MYLSKYKLGDIANVTISGVDKKIKEGETTVKLCNFVDVYHNWSITKDNYGTFLVASVTDKERNALSLKKGQVAITKDSETRYDIGISTFIGETFDDVVLGYHCALISIDEDIVLGSYLNAFLHSSFCQKYFELNATGSGMRYTLSVETINNLPIYAPPISEQKKIVYLLETLDRKIALNRKINAELEQMAKELYDYWFVQFDFPNAEGKPYKSSGGKMVYNDQLKRDIPEGWEVKSLNEIFEVVMDRIDVKEIDNQNYAPIEVLPRNKMSFYECSPIVNAISGLCTFKKNDILLSNRRVYFHKVCIAPFDGLTRDTVIILRPTNGDILPFAYQLVNSEQFISFATIYSYGSEQPVFSWNSTEHYLFPQPNIGLDVEYSKRVQSVIDKVVGLQLETKQLTSLRDQLLPLLMNGQVTIE